MGFKDWFDRKRRGYTDIDELLNPILAWRLQHFVCLPEAREHWLRHYFQFLNKEKRPARIHRLLRTDGGRLDLRTDGVPEAG
jgi:hypothetical protein